MTTPPLCHDPADGVIPRCNPRALLISEQARENHGGTPAADSVGGARSGQGNDGEEPRPGSNHGAETGTAHIAGRKKLPRELQSQLARLLKVLNMIPVVLEQR